MQPARMRRRRRVITAVLCGLVALAAGVAPAEQPASSPAPTTARATRDTYANPLDVLCADPFIYKAADATYYLYGTAAEDGLLVWTSKDLVNWRLRGHAFTRGGDTWANRDFWAPELFEHRGKFYLHFTAVGGDNGIRRLVLAQSGSPLGPFEELKAPWFDPGKQTIDGDVFRDSDGQLYLYSVQLGKPFQVQVRKLDANTLAPLGDPTPCIHATEPWEGDTVNEGPFVLKHGETYFLTYSAHAFDEPDYCVGLATAKSPLGPWTKQSAGPILIRKAGTQISGTGHHCFVQSPDGTELFIAYHTHQQPAHPSGDRQLCIDRARFVDSGRGAPTIRIDGPTDTPQPMPSGAPPLVRGQSDDFAAQELDRARWTIFNEDVAHWSIKDGRLVIRTQDGDVYQERSDLRNLFLQYAPHGDFDVTTRVSMKPEQNFEQAFLCLWQDHNNFTKIALVWSDGPKLEVAQEVDGVYASDLSDAPPRYENGIWLRLRRRGDTCEYLASTDGQRWQTLSTKPMTLIDLRIGIGAASPASGREIEAAFDEVRFAK